MARFTVTVESDLPPAEAWARLLDLRAHSRVIPLTTVRGDVLAAAGLVPGSRFVARTAVGPLGFDDVMVVDEVAQPGVDGRASARIRKEGRVIRGHLQLSVVPRGTGSRVDWEQEIGAAFLPGFVQPLVARLARVAYGSAIRRLLRG